PPRPEHHGSGPRREVATTSQTRPRAVTSWSIAVPDALPWLALSKRSRSATLPGSHGELVRAGGRRSPTGTAPAGGSPWQTEKPYPECPPLTEGWGQCKSVAAVFSELVPRPAGSVDPQRSRTPARGSATAAGRRSPRAGSRTGAARTRGAR